MTCASASNPSSRPPKIYDQVSASLSTLTQVWNRVRSKMYALWVTEKTMYQHTGPDASKEDIQPVRQSQPLERRPCLARAQETTTYFLN